MSASGDCHLPSLGFSVHFLSTNTLTCITVITSFMNDIVCQHCFDTQCVGASNVSGDSVDGGI